MLKNYFRVLVLLTSALLAYVTAYGQGTAFTYQGKLTDTGNLANGQYDFQFKLFDTVTVGTGIQQGATFMPPPVTVTAGLFTVQLDFGACQTCFNGASRFLEIAVKPTSGSTFTTLGPRQPITANPYAIRSSTATTADGLSVSCVNCVTSIQIASVNGSAVFGAIPVASLPAGSGNYIQNTTNPQPASNFNISGNGTAGGTLSGNVVNTAIEYRLSGLRILSVNGPSNDGFGTIFTASNTFTGDSAGLSTVPSPTLTSSDGKFNSFFGAWAGKANTFGRLNSFFGAQAGQFNLGGHFNSFFGVESGKFNTSGNENSFFGYGAGINNLGGADNASFGFFAGFDNQNGSFNSSFGARAGQSLKNGSNNTFIGSSANLDDSQSAGDNLTLLGANTTVSPGLSNSTAIGYRAQVTQDNSLILGAINGVNGCDPGINCDTVKVGIGTITPGAVLDVQRDQNTIPETARFTTYGFSNEILGRATGGDRANPTATPSGRILMQLGATGHDGTAFSTTPRATIQMFAADAWTSTTQGTFMRFNTTTSGTTATSTRMFIADDGNIGINTTAPNDKLEVNGIIRVNSLGAAGATSLCRNASNQIATCSSSLRYKTDIAPFIGGLAVIKRLRPITFTWKQGGAHDIGFGAEDVAEVAPLLAFRNDRDEIEGVKYDRFSVLLVNAIKEQQSQIEQQHQTIGQLQLTIKHQQQKFISQQQHLESLRKLVCLDHPLADICK